jgi:hypothetical protein
MSRGKFAQIRNLIGCERSRIEMHEITVYSSSDWLFARAFLAVVTRFSRKRRDFDNASFDKFLHCGIEALDELDLVGVCVFVVDGKRWLAAQ